MRLSNQTISRAVGLGLVVIALSVVLGGHAKAAGDSPLGLQISPVTIEANVDPGKTYSFNVSALNITTGDLSLHASINDFKTKDETGTPEVILSDSATTSYSLKHWLQVSDFSTFKLASRKTKVLNVAMTVPKDAEPGGHYGVIRFTGADSGVNQNNVSLIASWGTLVLVRVSGKIDEQLFVSDFYTSRNGSRSGWFEEGPIKFTERLYNNGNVHVKPQGDITITNMFGRQVGTVRINSDRGNILPKSTRKFQQSFNKPRMFGKYSAVFNLAYGTHGQVVASRLSFWVIPYKLVIISVVGIALAIWLMIRGIKRYNKRIVQKAMKNRR